MARVSAIAELGNDRNATANSGVFLDQNRLGVLRRRGDQLTRSVNHRRCSIASCELCDSCGGNNLGSAAQSREERRQVLADSRKQGVSSRFNDRWSQYWWVLIRWLAHGPIIRDIA